MADLFPGLALGDALDVSQAVIVPYPCETAVVKGQVVIFVTHTTGQLPTVATAGALAINVLGVALKTGAAGETVPVLTKGMVKVQASGGITAGVLIVSEVTGQVQTVGSNTFEKVIGRAIQTFTNGDQGIVHIGYP